MARLTCTCPRGASSPACAIHGVGGYLDRMAALSDAGLVEQRDADRED